jgi:glycine/D-amino acid oxidase-like deaminating enzyme
MQRRDLLLRSGAALWALGAPRARSAEPENGSQPFAAAPPLAPMQARPDRIIAINVCTRPFRARGPRIEAERVRGKLVVHNYGHGGSGWSLSWGSARLALQSAVEAGLQRGTRIAVVGCGAIGMTSALTAQRLGWRVRIYARERPPEVRSSWATGVWSPDSRICTLEHATPAFERRWEAMARTSHAAIQSLLGLPGDPVEYRDGYVLADVPFDQAGGHDDDGEPAYPDLEFRLARDLRPRSVALTPAQHPFPVPYARRYTQLQFNIAPYQRWLMDQFLAAGGTIETREFTRLRELAALPEAAVVNATGYGARALLGDDSIVPVRGQTARLVPQADAPYGITWIGHNLSVVSRRDGILVQAQQAGDFGSADTTPDRAASEAAVERLAALFRR